MSIISSFILLFSSLFFLIPICLSFQGCIQNERDALLQFKNGLTVPSDRLADWAADGSDCCRWTGVVCHNITAHVIELHLRTLSFEEYCDLDFSHYEYREYEEYYKKSALGGKVSSSLLQLKHLSYLDLSNNDFGGVSIPKFIGSMQSLRYLNLSNAKIGGMIPPQLGNLSNLHYLNLQGLYLLVENLDWVPGLSSLEFLDLSNVDLSQSFDWLKVMNSLPSLVELHLSYCHLRGFSLRSLPNLNFSSLLVLDLSMNYFQGPIPNILQNMTSFLTELDLSDNNFNSSIPNWLYDLTHLQLLHLRFTYLQGQVSSRIGNLTSLVSLDLSYNDDLEFKDGIPNSFQNFCNLRSLHLSSIKLNQEMNDILKILSSGCVLDGLQSLSLSPSSGNFTADHIGHFKNLRDLYVDPFADSMIHGPIPTSFKHLCNLRSLFLSRVKLNQDINDVLAIMSECVSNVLQSLGLRGCKLSGHLTDDLTYFKNLIHFDISDNLISGPIPLSFGNLKNLKVVYISNNDLEGEISHLHFANLTRLIFFYASRMGENITFKVSSNWIPPLQLESLDLGSWNIGSQFPKWLRLLKHLTHLDLSNSGISTPFPIWFCDSFSNYEYLNFSHNQMHGSIPNIIPSANQLFDTVIDLSSNKFSGVLPYFSLNVMLLDLSHNSFLGSIHHFLCHKMHQEKHMSILNLERNLLSGKIPNCWGIWNQLRLIRLSNNKFSGNIPNSIGTLSYLESLHLRNNNLSGEVPSSIQNCKWLLILDFGENSLTGYIPTWMGDAFDDLRILSLRSNKFNGYIPKELCHLVSLHILDLAHNSFTGTIPSCFGNFTGMATRNDSTGSFYYGPNYNMEGILLLMKGNVMEYSTNLNYVRSIDLSSNDLFGEIPTEITRVTGLLSLNLSQNALTGRIPINIGDMKGLEAIDFSHNQLSGEIPQSISTLTFLSTLDLSYNNLSGRIPSGTQLQSFNSSSFMGNHLCGLPLIKNCSLDDGQLGSREEKDENGDEVDVWFYESMAFGFVFGFWSAVGSLIFIRKWRHFYFRSLYNLGETIWYNFIARFH